MVAWHVNTELRSVLWIAGHIRRFSITSPEFCSYWSSTKSPFTSHRTSGCGRPIIEYRKEVVTHFTWGSVVMGWDNDISSRSFSDGSVSKIYCSGQGVCSIQNQMFTSCFNICSLAHQIDDERMIGIRHGATWSNCWDREQRYVCLGHEKSSICLIKIHTYCFFCSPERYLLSDFPPFIHSSLINDTTFHLIHTSLTSLFHLQSYCNV